MLLAVLPIIVKFFGCKLSEGISMSRALFTSWASFNILQINKQAIDAVNTSHTARVVALFMQVCTSPEQEARLGDIPGVKSSFSGPNAVNEKQEAIGQRHVNDSFIFIANTEVA